MLNDMKDLKKNKGVFVLKYISGKWAENGLVLSKIDQIYTKPKHSNILVVNVDQIYTKRKHLNILLK